MKKFYKVILLINLIFFLVSCTQGTSYTLDFDSNGGTSIETISFDGSSSIMLPENPEKDGYLFDGWYWDDETFLNPFSVKEFLDGPIAKTTTIFAKWIEQEETLNNQLHNIYLLAVEANFDGTYEEWLETVRGPQGNPGADGKEVIFQVFENYIQWKYLEDSSWTNLLEITTLIGPIGSEGMSAYDLYIFNYPEYLGDETDWLSDLINGRLGMIKTWEVVFVFNDETTEDRIFYVDNLSKIEKPIIPIREGYNFEGWYVDGEKWNFIGHVVTENIVLEAKWEMNVNDKISNHFYLKLIDETSTQITFEIVVGGVVSTCGFDIKILYSENVIKLSNINYSLSGTVSSILEEGIIRLNYVDSTKNLIEETVIGTIIFEKTKVDLIFLEIDLIQVIKLGENGLDLYDTIGHTSNYYKIIE